MHKKQVTFVLDMTVPKTYPEVIFHTLVSLLYIGGVLPMCRRACVLLSNNPQKYS